MANNFRFFVKVAQVPSKRVVKQCRYATDVFYDDINDTIVPSFNWEVKNPKYEKLLFFWILFKTHSQARYAEGQHRVKRVTGTYKIMPQHKLCHASCKSSHVNRVM